MFCPNCGSQIRDGAKFCRACGKPVNIGAPQQAAQAPVQPQVQQPVRQQAQAPVKPQIQPQTAVPKQTVQQPQIQQPVQARPPIQPQVQSQAAVPRQTVQQQQVQQPVQPQQQAAKLQAPVKPQTQTPIQPQAVQQPQVQQPVQQQAQAPVQQPVRQQVQTPIQPQIQPQQQAQAPVQQPVQPQPQVQAPVQQPTASAPAAASATPQAASSPMNQFLARLLGLFKDPRTIIPLAALVASWIGLSFAGTSTSPIIRALSWLTFGRAGLYGGAAGAVGGFLGKAALGTAVLSLCSGSAPALARGAVSMVRQIKAAFTGKNGPEAIVGIAAGMLLGAGVYIIFAGVKTATWETSMSAVAGSAISFIVMGRRFAGGLSGLRSKVSAPAQQTAQPQPQQGFVQQGFAQQAGWQQAPTKQVAQPQQGFAQQAPMQQAAPTQQTAQAQPQQGSNGIIPALLTGAAIGSPICALILSIV